MSLSSARGYALMEESDLRSLSPRFSIYKDVTSFYNKRLFIALDKSQTPPQQVVLRILPSVALKDLSELYFFLLESQAAAKLLHKNIIRSENPEQYEGIHFCVSEYKEDARPLRDQLCQHGWFSISQTINIGIQLAEALQYAHESEVLHLGMEPNNILIDKEDTAFLSGFGISKIPEREWAMQKRAQTCSLAYLSPEQLTNDSPDERSDLYMLGVVLYEMLTDLLPYNAQNANQLVEKMAMHPAPPPHIFRHEVPKTLSAIVSKLITRNPADRYQDAATLCTDLKSLFNEDPQEVPTSKQSLPDYISADSNDEDIDEPLAAIIQELEGEKRAVDKEVKVDAEAANEATLPLDIVSASSVVAAHDLPSHNPDNSGNSSIEKQSLPFTISNKPIRPMPSLVALLSGILVLAIGFSILSRKDSPVTPSETPQESLSAESSLSHTAPNSSTDSALPGVPADNLLAASDRVRWYQKDDRGLSNQQTIPSLKERSYTSHRIIQSAVRQARAKSRTRTTSHIRKKSSRTTFGIHRNHRRGRR